MKNDKTIDIVERERERATFRKKLNEHYGITIVALSITIIILIILSTVTINAVLGDNGLIEQAKTTKNITEKSIEDEAEKLNRLSQEYANLMSEDETIDIPDEGVTEDGVPIPEGFYYVGGTKEEGVVISDNPADENKGTSHDAATNMEGNQFVWIPVESESSFRRYEGYTNGNLQSYLDNCSEPFKDGYASEEQEYNNMRASVINNKGFYVGRYEAGTTNTARNENSGISDKLIIKQGQKVYNYVGWNNSETDAMNDETGGAVELAKGFARANGYTSVTSTLIYGVQWDAIMNFIDPKYATENCDSDSFVVDSREKGVHGQSTPIETGSNANYEVKNIYDLGGNAAEWTMEANGTYGRVTRGR